jgi:hypothetical protein
MLYDVALALDVKNNLRQAILSRVTQYEIYSYYLGHAFQIGVTFKSPFREDASPSFNIYRNPQNNDLLHKDFGDPRFVGDCFSFIEQIRPGTTYKDALNIVYQDIVLFTFLRQSPNRKVNKTT